MKMVDHRIILAGVIPDFSQFIHFLSSSIWVGRRAEQDQGDPKMQQNLQKKCSLIKKVHSPIDMNNQRTMYVSEKILANGFLRRTVPILPEILSRQT